MDLLLHFTTRAVVLCNDVPFKIFGTTLLNSPPPLVHWSPLCFPYEPMKRERGHGRDEITSRPATPTPLPVHQPAPESTRVERTRWSWRKTTGRWRTIHLKSTEFDFTFKSISRLCTDTYKEGDVYCRGRGSLVSSDVVGWDSRVPNRISLL